MYSMVQKIYLYLTRINTNFNQVPIAMKKTVTVSLGGMVFCLEEDAYKDLSAYLSRLERHFANDADSLEIVFDIESRMAEHLRSWRTSPDSIITSKDVERIVEVMGEPKDIGGNSEPKSQPRHQNATTYRRLFRNPDDSVLGGVCSGLGYYWNIDPVLLRIIFVVVALFGGGGVIIYIILWIVIPRASTNADKLEMKGEPVTAENIGRSFQDKEK